MSDSPPRSEYSWRRIVVALILLAILIGLLYIGYQTTRTGLAAWEAYRAAERLAGMVRRPAGTYELPALRANLTQLDASLGEVQKGVEPVQGLLPSLAGVPQVGKTLVVLPELLDAGRQAAQLGIAAVDKMGPEIIAAAGGGADIAVLATALAKAGPALPELAPKVAALDKTLQGLPADALPPQLAAPLRLWHENASLVEAAAELGPQLPWLLGMDGPRTYLLMVQNNDELRATGGFISAFGLITMDQGKVTSADFADSYTVFRNELPYPPAPAPMRRYMGIQLLTARDANWSPDLPTTAAVLRTLFERDTGVTIDGIITVDQGALRHLLTALGPVTVAGVAEPVTAGNVNEQMVKFWEQPGQFTDQSDEDWWLRRKDFMGVVAKELMTRLEAGDLPIRNLITELRAALVDRSLQLWLTDAGSQAALAANGWDGALHPEPGADFVAVVDANLGYNKVDAALQRSLDYSVTWPGGPAAPAMAALTVTYTHTATTEDPVCDPRPRYGDTYADLVGRCAFLYTRVYVPGGSQLLGIDGVDQTTAGSQLGEAGATEFAAFQILPPGETRSIVYRYQLPAGITPEDYRLIVQRQPGIPPLPVTVRIGEAEPVKKLVVDGRWRVNER